MVIQNYFWFNNLVYDLLSMRRHCSRQISPISWSIASSLGTDQSYHCLSERRQQHPTWRCLHFENCISNSVRDADCRRCCWRSRYLLWGEYCRNGPYPIVVFSCRHCKNSNDNNYRRNHNDYCLSDSNTECIDANMFVSDIFDTIIPTTCTLYWCALLLGPSNFQSLSAIDRLAGANWW